MQKAVVLCSGGLNSAVLLALVKQSTTPALLHAKFAHRAAQRDATQFTRLAAHFGISDRTIIELPHVATLGGSARVDNAIEFEDAVIISKTPSPCWIPGLMGALVHAGFAHARAIGARQVWLGISENLGPPCPPTGALYPDYSREYLQLLENALSVLSPNGPITIETPLIDLRRGDIIQLARKLEVPLKQTWSCQSSNETPCQRCVGCATRARGFIDAATPDPLLTRATVGA